MTAAHILKKIKALEIRTRKLVRNVFSGEYHSVFKGTGISFAEVREYFFSDDHRLIDWKVTAKMNAPFIKLFEEERELNVILMVDLSGSGDFGSLSRTKVQIAAEIAAVLGFSASRNNDKVGLLLFTDRVEHYIPSKKGKKHVMRLLRDIFYFSPKSKKTSISTALDALNKAVKTRSVVFLISDFMDYNFEKSMQLTSKKHDLVPIVIEDPHETQLPDAGLVCVEDPESGELLYLNTSDERVRDSFLNMSLAKRLEQDRFFKSIAVQPVRIHTNQSYARPLDHFFKTRMRR